MNFNTNQNRQFYVATGAEVKTCPKGDYLLLTLSDGTTVVRTDLLANIEYINVAKASELVVNKTKVTATLDGKYIVGNPVILTIDMPNYIGGGDEFSRSTAIEIMPASESTLDTSKLEKINKHLAKAFPEYNVVAAISGNTVSVTAYYKTSNWIVGVSPMREANVVISGEHVVSTVYSEVAGEAKTGNMALAELEYFCKGERGDQYRMMGYPNVIPSRPSEIDLTTDYFIYDIHFAYVGANEMVQQSEKDITIVSKTEILKGKSIDGNTVPTYPTE